MLNEVLPDNNTNLSVSLSDTLAGWVKSGTKKAVIYSIYLSIIVSFFLGGMVVTDEDDDNDIDSFIDKFENIGIILDDLLHEVSSGDTDGDGIADRIENNRDDLEADRKDIRLVVVYSSSTQELSSDEKSDLKEIWDTLQVSNPDDRSGVNVEIVEEIRADEELYIPSDASSSERNKLLDKWYDKYIEKNQCGNRRMIVLGEVRLNEFEGWGDAPGYSSIVDGGVSNSYSNDYSGRTRLMTHELLHNVVGSINGEHVDGDSKHTSNGWLSQTVTPDDDYLSTPVSNQLSKVGFRESQYHKLSVC